MNLKCKFFPQICLMLLLLCNSYALKKQVMINPKNIAQFGIKAIEVISALVSAKNDNQFQQQVIDSVNKIIENTQKIESLITNQTGIIIEELKAEINKELLKRFVRTVDKINNQFDEEYMVYFMGSGSNHLVIVEKFVEDILSRDFQNTLNMIEEDTVPTYILPHIEDKRLFEILHDIYKIEKNRNLDCDIGISANQLLYEAYNIAISTLSKGYIMLVHAYKYRQLHESDPDVFSPILSKAERDFNRTVLNISKAARNVMNYTSRGIRSCDPKYYIQGKNYKSFNFLSLYVPWNNPFGLINEDWMNSLLKDVRTESICHGESFGCSGSDIIKVCLAPPESGRRYEKIIEGGGFFDFSWYDKGHQTDYCEDDPMLLANSRGERHRSCLCREPYSQKKGALLNMTAQYTDIANNRVVTGIRFVTKWSITFIEIQDGELVNGTINPNSVRWNQDVSRMLEEYEQKDLVLPDDFYYLKDEKYKVLVDHLMNNPFNDDPWSEKAIINLNNEDNRFSFDDIILPQGMVVTGVKFEQINNNHIALAVAGTRMYDSMGNPNPCTEVQWFSRNHKSNREEIEEHNVDSPLYASTEKGTVEFSKPGKSIMKFQLTDYIKDASQTLIPFVDLKKIVTNPPLPIGGLGIFYKRQEGYGGFISLKLISFDYTIFMEQVFKTRDFNESCGVLKEFI